MDERVRRFARHIAGIAGDPAGHDDGEDRQDEGGDLRASRFAKAGRMAQLEGLAARCRQSVRDRQYLAKSAGTCFHVIPTLYAHEGGKIEIWTNVSDSETDDLQTPRCHPEGPFEAGRRKFQMSLEEVYKNVRCMLF